MNLNIQLNGLDQVQQTLSRLSKDLTNPQALLTLVGARLAANIDQRFDTKTDPGGEPWKAIGPNTASIYKSIHKSDLPGTLMERTRHMRQSITSQVIGGQLLEVGLSAPYAGYHETGTKRMPRRGMVFASVTESAGVLTGTLGADDQADALQVIQDYLVQRAS